MTDWEAREEMDRINSMSLQQVQLLYNVDTKEEAVRGVVEAVEMSAGEYEYTDWELEHERQSLCISLGLSRYC